MKLFFISVGVLVAASFFSWLIKKWRRHIACFGVFAASLFGILFSAFALISQTTTHVPLGAPLPYLNLNFGVDPLSTFFLLPLFGLSLLTSVYAWGYLKNQSLLLPSLPFFPLLVASMVGSVTARDGFLFLICWELMSLSSFFLVVAENELREVRHAGWIYLIATHLSVAFLIVFFVVLQGKSGSFLFEDWLHLNFSPFFSGALFLLVLIGFGTKAGLFPFHVWLPHAHPAAPSYISALMSGVMIKTGIYGLLRALTFLGRPSLWWGTTLISLGVLSALLGILYASVQGDLKKSLAFSSVENMGIIFVGIGLGLVGLNVEDPLLVFLSLGGALFHIWNHSLFKSLLFLGAGSLLHVTHTRNIEQLGGLLKKMPMTAITFLVGAMALCALPPFNGLISEFLIYSGLFRGAMTLSGTTLALAIVGIISIAFAGGVALASFSKIFGIVFLGEARSHIETIHEASRTMQTPLILLSVFCLLVGLFPQLVWRFIAQTLETLFPLLGINTYAIDRVAGFLQPLAYVSLFFLGLCLVMIFAQKLLHRKKRVRYTPTWDCGYSNPAPRMQYTASSFGQPMAVFFRPLLRPFLKWKKPNGFFPGPSSFSVHIADLAEKSFFQPLFCHIDKGFGFLRKIQKGRIQNYLALIFITLIVLLLWEVWFGI